MLLSMGGHQAPRNWFAHRWDHAGRGNPLVAATLPPTHNHRMLPAFDAFGNLPRGIHPATWQEIVDRFGTNDHRRRLLDGLRAALVSLKGAGCRTVYLNGSFVTAKGHPADFDGCWDLEDVRVEAVDLVLLVMDEGRSAQKSKYLGELIPAWFHPGGRGQALLDVFQTDRDGRPKGLVELNVQDDDL